MNDSPAIAIIVSAGRLLRILEEGPIEVDKDRIARTAIRFGLPRDDLAPAVATLIEAGLLQEKDRTLRLRAGTRPVIEGLQSGNWAPLASALLPLSGLRSQLALLIPQANVDQRGRLIIKRRVAMRLAPQVAVLLSWISDATGPVVEIPPIAIELGSLQEPVAAMPDWAEERRRVGKRAEHYSLLFERLRHPPHLVLHVAEERDDLGYDVEVATQPAPRVIEVKGSQATAVRFIVTRRELEEAVRRQEGYEVHFWGGIDLDSEMTGEYVRLTSRGYPRIFRGLAEYLASARLTATPIQWEVREPPKA